MIRKIDDMKVSQWIPFAKKNNEQIYRAKINGKNVNLRRNIG
jgi:hypothetical protein